MTRRSKIRSTIFVCAFFATLAVSTLLPSCSKEEKPDTSTPAYQISEAEKLVVPDAVALPANLPNGNTRVATFFADGVQKYKAQAIAGSNPVAYEWVFVAPQADLYDITNKKVGNHSAGPTWQLSVADSIYGQAFSPARTAPGADATSIDWLLLMPKTGKEPTGFFANVSYVQRVATKGGKAPTTPPANATDIMDVPYTAIYRFSKKNQ
jgi:hypothetical protein